MTKVYDTDKCFCRVHSINEKETLIEFFFPDGELVQKANTVLVNILKRLNLHEQGAEFYNISTETEDSLIVKIEPYIEESSDESELHKKYMKMSDALGPNTGPSSEENFYDDDEEEFNIVEFICKNPLTYNWYLQKNWSLKDFINCRILSNHKWSKDSGRTFRSCDICGRLEIREPTPPDGILTGWVKNYS